MKKRASNVRKTTAKDLGIRTLGAHDFLHYDIQAVWPGSSVSKGVFLVSSFAFSLRDLVKHSP